MSRVRAELPGAMRRLVRQGDAGRLASSLLRLSEDQRLALRPAFAACLQTIENPRSYGPELGPLIVAGAACQDTAARTAAWFARRPLRQAPDSVWDAVTKPVVRVLTVREVPWLGELAARVSHRDGTPGPGRWRFAAALVTAARIDVPTDDGFVLGWVAHLGDRDRLTRRQLTSDPFLGTLLPRLTGVAETGPLASGAGAARAALLDGCLAGLRTRPRLFLQLHKVIDPGDDEVAAHTDDYLELLPDGSVTVAGFAQKVLRRIDRTGRLATEPLLRASLQVFARPEPALARTQLTWLDEAWQRHSFRADELLAAACAAGGHPARDVRDLAAAFAERHGFPAAPRCRARLRAPAEPAGSARPHRSDADDEATLPAAAMPPPIESAAHLSAAAARLLDQDVIDDPIGLELVLDAIVGLAARQGDELRAALGPLAARYQHVAEPDPGPFSLHHRLVRLIATVTAEPRPIGRLRGWLYRTGFLGPSGRIGDYRTVSGPGRLLLARLDEITDNIGRPGAPVRLLATPTSADGRLDAATLIDRVLAPGGSGILWPVDLEQALLRLPYLGDPAEVARARKIRGNVRPRLVRRLRTGPPPASIRIVTGIRSRASFTDGVAPQRPAVEMRPQRRRGAVDDLLLSRSPGERPQPYYLALWPGVLPAQRDVVAAHALDALLPAAARGEADAVRVLPAIARCAGPAGPATALAMVCGLAVRDRQERVAAVDALVYLAATRAVDPAEIGRQVTSAVLDGELDLTTIVDGLGDLADRGTGPTVWRIGVAALTLLICQRNPAPGTAGLLDLTARLTPLPLPTSGWQMPIGLEQLAAADGPACLVVAAKRLRRALDQQGQRV